MFYLRYKHEFPFLEERLRLQTANLLYVDGLYKGVVYQEQPELFYIGAQDLFYSWTLFMQEVICSNGKQGLIAIHLNYFLIIRWMAIRSCF